MSDYVLLTCESRKARKPHKCFYCGEKIEQGSQYIYTSGSFEGSIQSDHWHEECREFCCETFDYSDWELTDWGSQERPQVK